MHLYALLLCAALWASPTHGQIVFSESAQAAGVDDGGTANGAAFGDVNGDGYADVLAASQLNDTAATDAGAAYLILGGGL